MNFKVWMLFAVTETLLCLTPGPAVLLVLSQALTRGARKSIWSSTGILAANAMYFIISATGLGAAIAASQSLFAVIKFAGAAYLIWLGVISLVGRSRRAVVTESALPVASRRLFLNGFVVQAANPKTLIFFTALLPQFIDPSGSVPFQVAILGLTSISIEFVVLAIYGLLAGRATHFARDARFSRWTERAAGSMLVGAGVGLARLRHS
ncbi:MAG TPA: LysE family translocator [Candidatus Acidoferrales bacterium]|nr:LysE family translocator [Candidatus Acidoferrales bacterium]